MIDSKLHGLVWVPVEPTAEMWKAVDHFAHAGSVWEAMLAAAPKPPQWRPIETAPKDGWFLAFKPGVAHIVGTILGSDHPDCEFDGGVHEAWSHQYVDGITHWMPLPAAPEEPGHA